MPCHVSLIVKDANVAALSRRHTYPLDKEGMQSLGGSLPMMGSLVYYKNRSDSESEEDDEDSLFDQSSATSSVEEAVDTFGEIESKVECQRREAIERFEKEFMMNQAEAKTECRSEPPQPQQKVEQVPQVPQAPRRRQHLRRLTCAMIFTKPRVSYR